jgi:hypothetical protein
MKQLVVSNIDSNWPNIEIEYHKPIELFIDSLFGYDSNKNSFKVLWVKESEAISHFKSIAIANKDKFDAILTFDEEILERCNNAHLMLFGTAWVHDYKFTEKKFQISHLTGGKNYTVGHKLRHKVHYKQNKISTPKEFYISQYGGVENFENNKILENDKSPLFDSQFHICIENAQSANYFTEKLIDCFVTKTIPIYFGAPNIEKYFDLNGILVANNFDEILNLCNSLTEKDYKSRELSIEKNFELAQKYITIVDRLQKKINYILNGDF